MSSKAFLLILTALSALVVVTCPPVLPALVRAAYLPCGRHGQVDALVPEDNDDLRRVFSQILAWAGYEIWPAGTLAEVQYRATCDALGVEFFLEKPVDLQNLLRLVERLTGAKDVL